MGVIFKAQLVAGLPVKALFNERTTTEYVTKYNEDTGKPYQKGVSLSAVYIGDRLLVNDKNEPVDLSQWLYDHRLDGNLFESDAECKIFGVLVVEAKKVEEVANSAIDAAKGEWQSLLSQYGLQLEPKLYLIQHTSI
jgi:hypothetical protein